MREVLLLNNADFSKILFVNRAYEAIWGRTVESLYDIDIRPIPFDENPRSWLEGIHPDERKHVQEAAQRVVDGESLENLECRVVRPDGSISWVRLRAEPVRDSSGHPRRIVGCIHEFTKRKLAEEQVKQAEKQLRLVLDTTPVLITSSRADGYHDFFSQRWLNYVGRSLEDLRGWGWTATIHPADVEGTVDK